MESGGVAIAVKMVEPENKIFTDLKSSQQIEQREFYVKDFFLFEK